MRILPYRTVQNTISGLVLSFLDINQQKRAADQLADVNDQLQEALEEQKKAQERLAYLSSFPEMNPSQIIESDRSGKVTYCNAAAERLFPGITQSGAAHPYLAGIEKYFPSRPQNSSQNFSRE